MDKLNWTNKEVKFRDIRLQKDFYIITLLNESYSCDEISDVDKDKLINIKVNSNILNTRLNEYFFNEPEKIKRDIILGLKWNLVLTQGFFYKVSNSEYLQVNKDPEEWYISFLEVASPFSENMNF